MFTLAIGSTIAITIQEIVHTITYRIAIFAGGLDHRAVLTRNTHKRKNDFTSKLFSHLH